VEEERRIIVEKVRKEEKDLEKLLNNCEGSDEANRISEIWYRWKMEAERNIKEEWKEFLVVLC
jgi:hypothetical protein